MQLRKSGMKCLGKKVQFLMRGIQWTSALALTLSAASGEDWRSGSPRKEIEPEFSVDPAGGRSAQGAWVIQSDGRQGLYGYWFTGVPVTGGKFYRFVAYRKTTGVDIPRRSAYARLFWDNGSADLKERPKGRDVVQDGAMLELYFPNGPQPGDKFTAEPEFPQDGREDRGWTELSGIYRAPAGAERMIVELSLQWAPGGRVEWSDISVTECPAPPPRKVRLAAVNFLPQGGATPMDNCRKAVPFVEEAARQKADLVVFSEHYLTQGLVPGYSKQPALESAEEIPGGETSNFFCQLAKKHNLYIVVGVYEKEGNRLYNTAVLFGPEGVVGKYRKTTPTAGEIAMGITPGESYPVFDTRFGKVGMMVCYDAEFPEVARQLKNNGAEVVALPAVGYPTAMGVARAMENQIYVVSSIFVDDGKSAIHDRLGISGIFGPEGNVLARAPKESSVAVVEVDLSKRVVWPWIGNWREALERHRPAVPSEAGRPAGDKP